MHLLGDKKLKYLFTSITRSGCVTNHGQFCLGWRCDHDSRYETAILDAGDRKRSHKKASREHAREKKDGGHNLVSLSGCGDNEIVSRALEGIAVLEAFGLCSAPTF